MCCSLMGMMKLRWRRDSSLSGSRSFLLCYSGLLQFHLVSMYIFNDQAADSDSAKPFYPIVKHLLCRSLFEFALIGAETNGGSSPADS
ncbi:hypothetical protein BJY04DRAFT_203257 [Aspergillus karnatakaensis]|uniref:uncharacterized protein n=1 Tax=Aspergillus karnatakaensis TaxID=1810916 RepID=UPI003CCE2C6F